MRNEDHLLAVARRQHGLVTLHDVRAAGGTPDDARYRVRTGRWVNLRRGVYAVAGHELTWHANVLADLLAAPPGSLASHRTAAVLWGLDGARSGRAELSVPRGKSSARVTGIVHRSTDLDLADATRRHGIPVTGIHRTLLDVSIRVTPPQLEQYVDDALRRRLVSWPDLYETLVHHSRHGRDGCGVFRDLLDRRWGERVVPDSVFERKVVALLATAGVPAPVLQHPVVGVMDTTIRLDLAWPAPMVAVELQSKRWHLNAVSFDRDKERLNGLRSQGWDVYEYTWRHYCDQPEMLVDQISAALRRRGEFG